VQSDDANARFNEVVMRHLDDAYGLARWLTGNSADAEDVVQEACLRALKGIGGFSGGNARAWVMAIVRNTAFSWLKRNRPKEMLLTDDIEAAERFAELPPGGGTPEDALIAKANAMQLEAAIAALPPHLRETFVLRDIQDMSYREIAAVTGAPIGTVMSRLARARAALVQSLGVER
jgi:RNA polymerase sigma factor (sigma-70 family)